MAMKKRLRSIKAETDQLMAMLSFSPVQKNKPTGGGGGTGEEKSFFSFEFYKKKKTRRKCGKQIISTSP
jgi:hypothetical protein